MKVPGPGHVTVRTDWEQNSTQGGWLKLDPTKDNSRGKAMISKENVPGPGAYSAKMMEKSGPAYSMYARPNTKDDAWVPGPGQYQPNSGSDSYYKAVKIGTGNRSNLGMGDRSKDPGPGHYAGVDNRESLSYSMGKATRIDNQHKTKSKAAFNVPGPGAYRIPYTVAEVPSYVMQRKDEFKFV